MCIHDTMHNEFRDLEAEMMSMVFHDVEVEPDRQELNGEVLARGANCAPDASSSRLSCTWFLGKKKFCIF